MGTRLKEEWKTGAIIKITRYNIALHKLLHEHRDLPP